MGSPLVVDEVDVPVPHDDDILIRVRSCGVVPNLVNILCHLHSTHPQLPLPPLPAIFGLDPAGEVVEVGSRINEFAVGDRVYVNPMRVCGTCRRCVDGDFNACAYYTFNGYFGFSEKSKEIYERYPTGGLAQYMHAPAYAAVKIPDTMSFDQAARFGYVGTAYAGLRRANAGPGSSVLINGTSGTLGMGAIISALALGATRILGVARDRALLADVKAIAPDRIEVMSTLDGNVVDWARELTDGEGVDVAIDCLPTGSSYEQFLETIKTVRRCGALVNVGGIIVDVPLRIDYLMVNNITFYGSNWFDPCHSREMSALAERGLLDMSVFEHEAFDLDEIDRAMATMGTRKRHGGFTNYVIHP